MRFVVSVNSSLTSSLPVGKTEMLANMKE
jgi:hypothetical protein